MIDQRFAQIACVVTSKKKELGLILATENYQYPF